jgi:aspartokinase
MLSVLKIGGSVLRDDASYAETARFLSGRLADRPDERLVVIVSAQYGSTDALLAEAQAIVAGPAASEGRREPPRSGGPSAQRGGEHKGAPPSGVKI